MSFCGICTVQTLKAFSTMKPIQVPATETEHHLTGAMSHEQLIPSNVDNYTLSQPRRDSNPQSSDSKSDALSIRPRGPFEMRRGCIASVRMALGRKVELQSNIWPIRGSNPRPWRY